MALRAEAGSQSRVLGQGGEEGGHVSDEAHGDGGVPRPDADPVSPGHQEGGHVPKASAGIGVGPAHGGHHSAEPGQHQSDCDGSGRGEEPSENADAAEGGQGGREEEDARPDHVAHHQGHGDQESELSAGAFSPQLCHSSSAGYSRGRPVPPQPAQPSPVFSGVASPEITVSVISTTVWMTFVI